jgi:large subunit ribosomal protein L10
VPTQEKAATVEDLKTRLGGAKTVVLTEYRGLTVQQVSELRRQLRAVSAQYKVVKNRLARLAVASSDLKILGPLASLSRGRTRWPWPRLWPRSPRPTRR